MGRNGWLVYSELRDLVEAGDDVCQFEGGKVLALETSFPNFVFRSARVLLLCPFQLDSSSVNQIVHTIIKFSYILHSS